MGKLPSCQLPLQPRVSLMDALGYLRSVLHWAVFFFNPFFFFFSRKLRVWDLGLFYICFGFQIHFLVAGNPQLCPILLMHSTAEQHLCNEDVTSLLFTNHA